MTTPNPPRTMDSIVQNLIDRVRVLEALPATPAAVVPDVGWAKLEGAKSGGDPVASPTADAGEALPWNSSFRTNNATMFQTGLALSGTPNNQVDDPYLLCLKPGAYMVMAVVASATPSSRSPWPTQTAPYLDIVFSTFSEKDYMSPNQAGFQMPWTLTTVYPPRPPVFTNQTTIGNPLSWANDAYITVVGSFVVDIDVIEAGFWAGLRLMLVNQSGGDVGVAYEMLVWGITGEDHTAINSW